MKAHFKKYVLDFKTPSGTSRGILKTKESWFLILTENEQFGIGECSLLSGLSYDDRPEYEDQLERLCTAINTQKQLPNLVEWPSIRFGYEMALLSLQSTTSFDLFPSKFTRGENAIAINGLVWMGESEFMQQQIETLLNKGFNCIKLKIGAIDFEEELRLIASIRNRFDSARISIRVDANGAFSPEEALHKLDQLSQYELHSIEQPIAAGQWEKMKKLCAETPIPIALDEELIGVHNEEDQKQMLSQIAPQYIILKPSLVGGFAASDRWIRLAEERNIEWWATSALESNIGLNAIAQWTFNKKVSLPQGLGTGSLFTNNIESPLEIKNGYLTCETSKNWNFKP